MEAIPRGAPHGGDKLGPGCSMSLCSIVVFLQITQATAIIFANDIQKTSTLLYTCSMRVLALTTDGVIADNPGQINTSRRANWNAALPRTVLSSLTLTHVAEPLDSVLILGDRKSDIGRRVESKRRGFSC